MPSSGSGQKPSELAHDAKRGTFPYLATTFIKNAVTSYYFPHRDTIPVPVEKRNKHRTRVAVQQGDLVDCALDWQQHQNTTIALVNPANENRPAGDWESAVMAPEECFARRSNLFQALTMSCVEPNGRGWSPKYPYPIAEEGGIYSPQVYVYRHGPEQDYEQYGQMKWLPVISVAPVRRPKLAESGTRYSFEEEKERMRNKMRAVLRIAAYWNHERICIGAFGVGPGFRNPVAQVASMWRELLFSEAEFIGVFKDVVFAIDTNLSRSSGTAGRSDVDVFSDAFNPDIISPTTYR